MGQPAPEIKDNTPNFKELFRQAPDTQLDKNLQPLVEEWDEPHPTAIQILKLLDHVIYGDAGSEFTVLTLQALYDAQLKEENTTHDEVVKLATWRNEQN